MSKRKALPPKASRPWILPVIALALLAFGVYVNSLSNGFVGDDQEQLLSNHLVSEHRLTDAFGSGVWAFRGVRGNYYRPLQFAVYIALHSFLGYQAFAFHLFMLLLHAGCTLLVYFLSLRVTGNERGALAAGALFAIHPIHTEVVDWIASLPDLMMTLFVVAAVLWFARQGSTAHGWRVIGHAALYLAALLSKETGVILLPLYVGYERLVLGRSWRELRKNSGLYGAMAAALAVYLAARWAALGGLAPAQQTFHKLGPGEFVMSAVVVAAEYAGRLVLPIGLNYFHIFHATHSVALCLGCAAALGIVGALGLAPGVPAAVRYGILWILLAIAPALNITGVGQNVFAERYLYLPSVGFVWIAGLAWDWCTSRRPRVAWAAGIAVLCAGAWYTMARNPDWRDDFTLLRVTLAQSPEAGVLHNNLAGAYVQRNEFDAALREERLAVKYEPLSAPFHKNLGLLLMPHDPRAAAAEFAETLRLQPSDDQARGLWEEAKRAVAQ